MTFFDRLLHKVKGAANDALDAHQNIGADARQNVRELTEQLQQAETALVDVRAQAALLKGKREKAAAEVAKWLQAATNVAGKDDNLARECLQKKATAAGTLKQVEDEIARFQPVVERIEARINELRTQKENLANQADLIGVRSEVADVELKAAAVLAGIGGNSVSMADTESALARKEARAQAATSVLNDSTGASLEARLAAVNTAPSIEDELAALKAAK